jgi:hypothetical protein
MGREGVQPFPRLSNTLIHGNIHSTRAGPGCPSPGLLPNQTGTGRFARDGQAFTFKNRAAGEGGFVARHQRHSHSAGPLHRPLSKPELYPGRHHHSGDHSHCRSGEPVWLQAGDAAFWLEPMTRAFVDRFANLSHCLISGHAARAHAINLQRGRPIEPALRSLERIFPSNLAARRNSAATILSPFRRLGFAELVGIFHRHGAASVSQNREAVLL